MPSEYLLFLPKFLLVIVPEIWSPVIPLITSYISLSNECLIKLFIIYKDIIIAGIRE